MGNGRIWTPIDPNSPAATARVVAIDEVLEIIGDKMRSHHGEEEVLLMLKELLGEVEALKPSSNRPERNFRSLTFGLTGPKVEF